MGCREIDSPKQRIEFGQQKINFNFYELALPDDDPVYTLKKVLQHEVRGL